MVRPSHASPVHKGGSWKFYQELTSGHVTHAGHLDSAIFKPLHHLEYTVSAAEDFTLFINVFLVDRVSYHFNFAHPLLHCITSFGKSQSPSGVASPGESGRVGRVPPLVPLLSPLYRGLARWPSPRFKLGWPWL